MYLKHVQRSKRIEDVVDVALPCQASTIHLADSHLLCTPPPHHHAWGFPHSLSVKVVNNIHHTRQLSPQPIKLTLSCVQENGTRPGIPAPYSIFHICMLNSLEPCHPAAVSAKQPLLPSLHHAAPDHWWDRVASCGRARTPSSPGTWISQHVSSDFWTA